MVEYRSFVITSDLLLVGQNENIKNDHSSLGFLNFRNRRKIDEISSLETYWISLPFPFTAYVPLRPAPSDDLMEVDETEVPKSNAAKEGVETLEKVLTTRTGRKGGSYWLVFAASYVDMNSLFP